MQKGGHKMKELQYSILRYKPSVVSGEIINIGAIFYYPDNGYREFYNITKWRRISSFDDTLNVPLMKDLMEDIRDEIGTQIDNPEFTLDTYRYKFHSELFFDVCEILKNIRLEDVEEEIQNIKKLYFQFEYDVSLRPNKESQKKFLRRLLESASIKYRSNYKETSKYGDTVTYDYKFQDFGVVFINLASEKVIDNKIMNKVKAWAWNAQNASDDLKLLILYDAPDPKRADIAPAINILKSVAYQTINIHSGFTEVSDFLNEK